MRLTLLFKLAMGTGAVCLGLTIAPVTAANAAPPASVPCSSGATRTHRRNQRGQCWRGHDQPRVGMHLRSHDPQQWRERPARGYRRDCSEWQRRHDQWVGRSQDL